MTRVFRYIGEAPKPHRPLVSPALRNAARGRPCTLRWANDCDGGTETTVLAHIRGTWSGIGQKPADWFGIWCCFACHDHLDRRREGAVPDSEVIRALHETWSALFDEGLLTVKGAKP